MIMGLMKCQPVIIVAEIVWRVVWKKWKERMRINDWGGVE